MDLRDKTVIVTGASAGIGRATSELFAEKGAYVVMTARREDRLNEIRQRIELKGGRAEVWAGDITDEQRISDMVASVADKRGQLDILINNAGYGLESSIVSIPTHSIKRLFDVNLFGYFYAARAVIPYMVKQKSGHIMNVSSMIVQAAVPFMSYYTATKAAIAAWSRCMRAELEPLGIKVSEVYPGNTATEFYETAPDFTTTGSMRRYGHGGLPPEAVARAIVHAAEQPVPEVYPFKEGAR